MFNNKFKTLLASIVIGFSLSIPIGYTSAYAMSLQDTEALQAKRDLIDAMINQTTETKAKQIDLDNEAKASLECSNMELRAEKQAIAVSEARAPIDPAKIIPKTTCFVDVAKFPIKILSIGIGFIDNIIKSNLQKFLTNSCKGTEEFLNEIKSAPMNAISGDLSKLNSIGSMLDNIDNINPDALASELDNTIDSGLTIESNPLFAQIQNNSASSIDSQIGSSNKSASALVNDALNDLTKYGNININTLSPSVKDRLAGVIIEARGSLTDAQLRQAAQVRTEEDIIVLECAIGQKVKDCPMPDNIYDGGGS